MLSREHIARAAFTASSLISMVKKTKKKHLEDCSETDAVKIGYPREGICINDNNNQNNHNLML